MLVQLLVWERWIDEHCRAQGCQWCGKVSDRDLLENLVGSFCFSLQIACMRDAAGRCSILIQSSSSPENGENHSLGDCQIKLMSFAESWWLPNQIDEFCRAQGCQRRDNMLDGNTWRNWANHFVSLYKLPVWETLQADVPSHYKALLPIWLPNQLHRPGGVDLPW